MAITQNELITALQTLLSTTDVRLVMRKGLASQLDLASMVAGELAVATDTQEVYACFGDGIFRNLSRGIVIKGVYANLSALQAAHPTGTEGDIYAAGSAPQHLYVWTASAWVDMGAWNDTTLFATSAEVGAIDGRVTMAESDIAALGNRNTVKSVLLNFVSPATAGTLRVTRCGNTVQMLAWCNRTLSTTAFEVLWETIPVGYRPTYAVDNEFGAAHAGSTLYTTFAPCLFKVGTDGVVSVVSTAASKTGCTLNATWTTGDAYPA